MPRENKKKHTLPTDSSEEPTGAQLMQEYREWVKVESQKLMTTEEHYQLLEEVLSSPKYSTTSKPITGDPPPNMQVRIYQLVPPNTEPMTTEQMRNIQERQKKLGAQAKKNKK